MPKGYRHLAYEQRCQIFTLIGRGISQSQIAQEIKVSQSTVSRELKNNSGKRGYRFKQAHLASTVRRQSASSSYKKFTLDLAFYVEKMLREEQWSPEQISGRLKTRFNISISHERIYQHIWKEKLVGGTLYKHLRRRGKKNYKRSYKNSGRGQIRNRIGIEERPAIVDLKERIGDFEVDTIVGAHHRGAILSLVDRKSKLTFLSLLSRADAQTTSNAIIDELAPIKGEIQTITADNGKEFAYHQKVTQKLGAPVYFARPYCSWERGLNENTNGLVRQYFPKKTDFSKLTQQEVKKIEYLLNTRPRKKLNYRTPLEVFYRHTGIKLNYALHS